jgi:hypothetical protein
MTQATEASPSLVTQMLVAEKYGMRLDIDALAKLLGMGKSTIYNQISADSFAIPTYVDNGKRYADYRAVAGHLDSKARQSGVKV